MCAMTIGDLSRQTATPVATIRYYEEIGLMPPAPRGPGGQRRFRPADRARLDFIRTRRALGFSLADIARLLAGAGPDAAPCAGALPLAQEQLARTRTQIARLTRIAAELEAQIAACGPGCGGDTNCLLLPA